LYATRPCGAGAVLVFLPGWREIEDVRKSLERSEVVGRTQQREQRVLVYTLHSGMTAAYQLSAFDVPEDPSVLKIVLSTNIAESSVTIPDVVYVIDSGLQKQR
jgi:ATP-dependent RNA helicase DHX36